MGDLELDQTNEGYRGTEIQAQDDFSPDHEYVFQANATHLNADVRLVDGLHGFGYKDGRGVVGVGGGRQPMDVADYSDHTPQGEGVFGRGGDVPNTGDDPGMGVRGIGGFGGSGDLHRGGFGVHGRGGRFGGHGVFGEGEREGAGTGVLGFSDRGRGATFTSGSISGHVANVNHEVKGPQDDVMSDGGIAQLRLVPSSAKRPPAAGRIGDLLALAGTGQIEFYLCMRSSTGKDTDPREPAEWAPIQLGTSIPGAPSG